MEEQEIEISTEAIVKKIMDDLNKLDSNKDRNEYMAGVIASFQMQTIMMGQYLAYLREWIADNVGENNLRSGKRSIILDPDEYMTFHAMEDKQEFNGWLGNRRMMKAKMAAENAPKIITLS